MRGAKKTGFTGLMLSLLLLTVCLRLVALPMWLDAPARSNPNDPKNPAVHPTATMVPTAGATTPANTKTATITFSPTIVVNSYTASPVYSPTLTNTPGGHGPLVADFENNATNDRTLWGGAIFTAGWGGITSITPNPWPANAGAAPGNGSSFCGHIGGTVDTQANGGGAYLALELNMGGEDHTLAATDVTSYSPNQGLQFDYKADASAVGTEYLVELVQNSITDSAYWRFVLAPADSNWHTIVIYFPNVAGAPSQFNWGSQAWDPTHLGAILFQLNTKTTAQTIGLSIDNVTFAVPVVPSGTFTPTPNPTAVVHTSLVADFEDNATNDRSLWGGAIFTYAAAGSTITPSTWLPTSGTAPGAGNPSSYCANFSGTLVQDTGQSPVAFLSVELTLDGTNKANANVDVTSYCPNNGLRFDYKGDGSGATYRVELVQGDFTNYAYWNFKFCPADTNWHTIDIYFPSVLGATNNFAGGAIAFNPTKLGAILFQVQPNTSQAVNYGLSVDNVTFNAPAPSLPTTPVFNLSNPQFITDFEASNNTTNDSLMDPFTGANTGLYAGMNLATITPASWGATSGTAPGADYIGTSSPSGYCGRIYGDLTASWNSYALLQLTLAPFGWPNGLAPNGSGSIADIPVNIATVAPNKRFIFDYKAGAAGLKIQFQVNTSDIGKSPDASPDWTLFQYEWIAPDAAWHTVVIYFPDASYSPKLGAANVAWNGAHIGAVIFKIPGNGTAFSYDLSVDNVRFD